MIAAQVQHLTLGQTCLWSVKGLCNNTFQATNHMHLLSHKPNCKQPGSNISKHACEGKLLRQHAYS